MSKSIREQVLSTDETPKKKQSSFYDDEDYRGGENYSYERLGNDYPPESYKIPSYKKLQPGQLEITTRIENESIGIFADFNSNEYNCLKAAKAAKEIAYDRIVALAGKDFISKYSIEFETEELYSEYEVKITLTPTK
jgi:hypothetical protein